MTNEQLAEFIQQGGNDELLPLLWDKCRKLVYMRCEQLFRANSERFTRHGFEEWDFKQSAYEGFLKAIEAYKPDKSYKFITYLGYHIRNVMRDMLGRSEAGNGDALNMCLSLESATVQEGDELIGDTIPDEAAIYPFEEIEAKDTRRVVRETVELLPLRERSTIKAIYFENRAIKDIGKEQGVSYETVRQNRDKALRILKQFPVLYDLYDSSITYASRSAAACLRIGSTVETDAERREMILHSSAKKH